MNIENLVDGFSLSYRSAVAQSGCADRLPDTRDVSMPVIWERDGREVAIVDLCSYDSTASSTGIREFIGFVTDCGKRLQFIIEGGKVYHDLYSPVSYD